MQMISFEVLFFSRREEMQVHHQNGERNLAFESWFWQWLKLLAMKAEEHLISVRYVYLYF